ncbi:MAG: hypothetical protein M3P18_17270 [Actinomycetota bacterium]|nr:hypothetical protein [Actinomycetota bacterium]
MATTSGTTGLKGLFVYDRNEWVWVLASYARANDWARVPAGLTHRLRLAVVSTTVPWHQSAIVGASLNGRWSQRIGSRTTESICAASIERALAP